MTFWFWPQIKDGSFRTKTEGCTSTYISPTAKASHVDHPVHAFSSRTGTHQLGTSQLETSSAGSTIFTLVFWGARTSQTSWNIAGCKLALAVAQGPAASSQISASEHWGLHEASCCRSPAWAGQTVHASSGSSSIFLSSAISHTDGSCSTSHKVIWKYASGCFLMPPNWFVN